MDLVEVSALLEERFTKDKTLGMLLRGKGSFINCYNTFTHRIHGKADTLGAVSGRFTHSKPNVTQAPRDPEFRKLLCVPDNRKFIDIDGDALEAAILGHYLAVYDDGYFAEAVYSGDKTIGTDIHTINQKVTGLPTRDLAKTFLYSVMYGAGATKVGMSIWDKKPFEYTTEEYQTAAEKVSFRCEVINNKMYFPISKSTYIPMNTELIEATIYGSRTVDAFRDGTKGYKQLIADKIKEIKHNKIEAIDGRLLNIRSEHKVLNVLIQSAGAIFMKYVLVDMMKNLSSRWTHGKEFAFILNIHDGISLEVYPEIAEEVCTILENSFVNASKELNLARPVKAKAHIGTNQQDAH